MRLVIALILLLLANVAVMARTLVAAERIEAAIHDLVELRLQELGHGGPEDAAGR